MVRHPRKWLRCGAVGAMAIGFVACGGDGPASETVEFPVPWSEVKTVDDDTVELHYSHGPCTSYVRTDVQETPSQVVLRIILRGETNRPCTDLGVLDAVTVDLPTPLGGRQLVNGACENEDFAKSPGYPGCSSSTTTSGA